MKKILLLGGSAQQTVAIRAAKELGYFTIVCDYLPDNPGQYIADRFYGASTTDVEAIYEIARRESMVFSPTPPTPRRSRQPSWLNDWASRPIPPKVSKYSD